MAWEGAGYEGALCRKSCSYDVERCEEELGYIIGSRRRAPFSRIRDRSEGLEAPEHVDLEIAMRGAVLRRGTRAPSVEEMDRLAMSLCWMDDLKESLKEGIRSSRAAGTYLLRLSQADGVAKRSAMPKRRIPSDDWGEKVTLPVEGLNFDIPDRVFLYRFGWCKERRLEYGHSGIHGIMFIHFE